MALDDVPPGDMFWFGTRDPLDAALRGESDDPAVDVLVRDLRATYLPEGTRPRSEALAAFAGPADGVALGTVGARPDVVPVPDRPVSIGRRVLVGAAAFAATITGKVVLGGAVAAATLGGLHATDTVDVPLLPRSPQAQTVPSTVPELPDAAHPFNVLVGPPAYRSSDGVPAIGAPAPAEPSDRSPVAPVDQGVTTDDDRIGTGAPATTAPPITEAPADAPVPTTAGPSEQPPATEAPERVPGAAPEPGAGADRPAAGEQAPAPATEQENPARP